MDGRLSTQQSLLVHISIWQPQQVFKQRQTLCSWEGLIQAGGRYVCDVVHEKVPNCENGVMSIVVQRTYQGIQDKNQ